MRIGIISNSEISVPLLHYLKAGGADIIVYAGKKPSGGNNRELVGYCGNASIPLTTENNKTDLYSWLNTSLPDIVFVLGYSYRINLTSFVSGLLKMYNIHFGKLPEFRGPSPVFWQLKEGVENLFITIHEISDQLDAGATVWEKKVKNEEYFNYTLVNELFKNMLVEGVHFILNKFANNLPLQQTLQDDSRARYFFKPALKDVKIDWNIMGDLEILNLIRACNSWNKGAITVCNNAEIKILDAIASNEVLRDEVIPGTILETNGSISVACKNNQVLQLHYLSINDILVPARFSRQFGFEKGTIFN